MKYVNSKGKKFIGNIFSNEENCLPYILVIPENLEDNKESKKENKFDFVKPKNIIFA